MMPSFVLFGITFQSSLFFWGVGIIGCQIYYQVMARRKMNFRQWQALLMGLIFLIIEIIGAKILYLAENIGQIGPDSFGLSGFSFFGVFMFFPIFVFPVALLFRRSYADLMDYGAVGGVIQLAFYRIGCMCAGCCHGIEWEYGILAGGVRCFPVQPIEAGLDFALAAVLIVFGRRLGSGQQYLWTLTGYGIIRFILEFLRARTNIFLCFSVSHLWAFLSIVGGAAVLIWLSVQKKRTAGLQNQTETDQT